MTFKCYRACDADLTKLKNWPYAVMPKLDGVRGMVVDGQLVGRSGKPFKNPHVTTYFSNEKLNGLDGELVYGHPTDKGVCGKTTGLLNSTKADPQEIPNFHVFDSFEKYEIGYSSRLLESELLIEKLHDESCWRAVLKGIQCHLVYNQTELESFIEKHLKQGYEGTIIRDINTPYKFGKCTAKEASYLRKKPFDDTEIMITGIEEGNVNTTEMTRKPNGDAERLRRVDNLEPNGMVGSIIGELLTTVVTGGVTFSRGTEVKISAGCMTHKDRKYYFENPTKLFGKIAKFKYFDYGVKDAFRMPTFQSFRAKEDM